MAPPSAPKGGAVVGIERKSQPALRSWSRHVGWTGTKKRLEALASFVLSGEITGTLDRFGAGLGSEQTLQLQRLLHPEPGKLVAGLGDFERTACIAGAGHGVVKQSGVNADAVGNLALNQG